MLSGAESAALLSVLAEDKSFKSNADAFSRAFSPARRFTACCALSMLLEDGIALKGTQRLISLFLLHHSFHNEPPKDHPFAPLLLHVASEASLPAIERCFALNLLSHSMADVPSKSARDYVHHFKPPNQLPSREAIYKAHPDIVPSPSSRSATSSAFNASPAFTSSSASLFAPIGPGGSNAFRAAAVPRVLKCSKRTVAECMQAQAAQQAGMPAALASRGSKQFEEDKRGMTPGHETAASAASAALAASAVSELLSLLSANPSLITACGLHPLTLPPLVEHNPDIAACALTLLLASQPAFEYLEVLSQLPLTLHSLEVVSRVAKAVDLPPDFIHSYASHCMRCCEETKDKSMQNRLVRIVCIFLLSLIRDNIINVEALFIEMQAFCIEYSRVREAAALFRMLKSLE
ncbi:unnamed protein product [Closterium sp. Yama58-4]|nr:unnamed protein product [Closterium sp. Yama58-4]